MEISYDPEADAMAIWFRGVKSVKTIDVSQDIFVDVDADGGIAGIEILHVRESLPQDDALSLTIGAPDQPKATVNLADWLRR